MLFFIFGVICGMWLAQSFTMPNVQATITRWTQSQPQVEAPNEENPEAPPPSPTFTGEMPEVKH